MEGDQQPAESKARFRIGVFAVIEREGRYLLARRRDIGWWNLAGGGLEYGESVEEGLAREVREEIGANIAIERLLGVYSKPRKNEVVLAFVCHLTDDSPRPGPSDEVSEVAWFLPNEFPPDLLPKLAGLLGAVIGTVVAALVYVPLVGFVERGLRSRADSGAEGETLEQEISLLRRAVFAADIIVLAGIGYWLGGMVGD